MNIPSSAKSLIAAPIARNPLGKRRSNRMGLSAAIRLSGEDRQKSAFTISAKAINLNLHGGAVQLTRELPIGSIVILRNAHGTELSAKVVTQISAIEGGARTYGIEFVDRDDRAKKFWGISFPTA